MASTLPLPSKRAEYFIGNEAYEQQIFDPVTRYFFELQSQHPHITIQEWVKTGLAGAYVTSGSKFNAIVVVIDTGRNRAGKGRFEIEIVKNWYELLASDVANFIAGRLRLSAVPYIDLYYGGDQLKNLSLERVRELRATEDIRVVVDSSKAARPDPRRKSENRRDNVVEVTNRDLAALQKAFALEVSRILRLRLIGADQNTALAHMRDSNFLQPIVSCALRNPLVHGSSNRDAYIGTMQKYGVTDIGGVINDVVQKVMACACSLRSHRKKKNGKKTAKQSTTVAISSSMRDMLDGSDQDGTAFQQDLIACGMLGTLQHCWNRVLHCKRSGCAPRDLPKRAYCQASSSSSSSDHCASSSSSSDGSCSSDSGSSSGSDDCHKTRHARKQRRYHSGRYRHYSSDENSCSSSSDEHQHQHQHHHHHEHEHEHEKNRNGGASGWRVYRSDGYSAIGHEVEDGGAGAAGEQARIQVVHLIPDAPALDIYIGLKGGEKVRAVEGIAYGDSLPYIPLVAGTYDVDVRANSQTILSLDSIELGAGKDYTIAAIGSTAEASASANRGATLVAFEDHNSDASTNLRVLHAAPNAGQLDVYVDDVFVFGPVDYAGIVSPSYVSVPTGGHKLSIKAAGSDRTVLEETVTLAAGKIYTVVVYGLADRSDTPLSAKIIMAERTGAAAAPQQQHEKEEEEEEKHKKTALKSVVRFHVRVIGDEAAEPAETDDFEILGADDDDDELFGGDDGDEYSVPVSSDMSARVSRSIMSEDRDTMPALVPIKHQLAPVPDLVPIEHGKLTSIADALEEGCCASETPGTFDETCECCSNFMQLLESSGVGEEIEEGGYDAVVFAPSNSALTENTVRSIQSQSPQVVQKYVRNYIHYGTFEGDKVHKTIGSRLFDVRGDNKLVGTSSKEYVLHSDLVACDPAFPHVQYVPHDALHRNMKASA